MSLGPGETIETKRTLLALLRLLLLLMLMLLLLLAEPERLRLGQPHSTQPLVTHSPTDDSNSTHNTVSQRTATCRGQHSAQTTHTRTHKSHRTTRLSSSTTHAQTQNRCRDLRVSHSLSFTSSHSISCHLRFIHCHTIRAFHRPRPALSCPFLSTIATPHHLQSLPSPSPRQRSTSPRIGFISPLLSFGGPCYVRLVSCEIAQRSTACCPLSSSSMRRR